MGRNLLAWPARMIARWTLLVILSVPARAVALTPPIEGAVAKPAELEISWPFEDGERIYLTSGYSPTGGSSLHDGTNRASSANDYYALDMTLPDHADGGLGQPVLAVAGGTVVRAGWATEGWASYGIRVIIEHDYRSGDGAVFVSIYCHMNATTVVEGQHVEQGEQVGELGGSSNGSLTGLGYHLHWALHRGSTIGGSGTGGSYGGNAVVPEVMDGFEDHVQGATVVSGNGGGDPAAPCQVIGAGETIIEDDGPCFRRSGPSQYWHEEASGSGDHSIWTYTTDDPEPTNSGSWALYFESAGEYSLWAFIPSPFGESERAAYRILHAGTETEVQASQPSAAGDWLSLGSFAFAAGGDQWVRLDDDTGEPYVDEGSATRIAFDAVRVRATASEEPPDAGPAADAGADDDPRYEGSDAGSDPGGTYPGADGCTCIVAGSSHAGRATPWHLGSVIAFALVRRKMRRPRRRGAVDP